MPKPDGHIRSRDLADDAVNSRVLADGSVKAINLDRDLQSDNYQSGSSGWRIARDTGDTEFNDVTVRGRVEAQNGTLGDLTVTGDVASENFAAGSDGFRLGQDGSAEFNDLTIRDGVITGFINSDFDFKTGQTSTSVTLANTFTDVLSVSFTPPSNWGNYKVGVKGDVQVGTTAGAGVDFDARITIGSSNGSALRLFTGISRPIGIAHEAGTLSGAITIKIQARWVDPPDSGADAKAWTASLMAIIIRSS